MTAPAGPAGHEPHAIAPSGTLPHQPQPDAVPSLAAETAATCRHRWRIAAPNGSTSPGVCTQCGAQQQFPNALDDSIWDTQADTRAASRHRWGRSSRREQTDPTTDAGQQPAGGQWH
jgi:hypothetical protein